MGRKRGVPAIKHSCISTPYQTHLVGKQEGFFIFFISVVPEDLCKRTKQGGKTKKGCDAQTRQDKHNSKAQSDEVVH